MNHPAPTTILHLRSGGVSLVLDTAGPGLPCVLHWGRDLGDVDAAGLAALREVSRAQIVSNMTDEPASLSLLPEASAAWLGTPGVSGHRAGRDFSPAFEVSRVDVVPGEPGVAHRVVVGAADPRAQLELTLELELTDAGLVRVRATLRNAAGDAPYTLDALWPALPVPVEATEILDFTGRHLRERSPQRHPFPIGTYVRENRRGRTGADATLLLLAGTAGFGFGHGEVWGVHVAWSGNHRTHAERVPSSEGLLGGGELLLPGEATLGPGERYTSPWLYGAWGRGLDGLSARFHDQLRARPHHPATPRPVVLNTWEAVYFEHDLGRLTDLADAAAEVGVERFVLDDGWFRGRRDDTAGLGDWYVDAAVWPQGLHPLVEHVRALGMQFGLWVEPEMVNPDSDLARAHPEWILSPGGRLPRSARSQQVLDVAHPDAWAYLLERLDALVGEYRVDYLKWDHNRDLIEPGRSSTGRAGVHEQTRAVYRLLDALKARHPGLEIESCSSGGSRVDLGILEHTDRVWASDCIDALERQQIERWTGLLLPPELIGSHVAAPVSHTTGRAHTLPLRAGTALFGHFGIEWDLTSASPGERTALAAWVDRYKAHRALLHTGRVVRGDHPDPALLLHGVVAADRSEALYRVVTVATSVFAPPGRLRLPGLDPDARYRLTPSGSEVPRFGPHASTTPWWLSGAKVPGRVLAEVGVQVPAMHPEQLVLIHAVRV